MIKRLSSLIILAGVLYAVAACKKEKTTVPPGLAHFNLNGGSYFVTDDPNTVWKIPVGLTATAGAPTTIQIGITSPTGATEGQQYTIPSKSITIPAGGAVDTLLVKGIFGGYPVGRKDTLVFTISGGDVMPSSKEYRLIVQKYCDVVLSDLEGLYNECFDKQEGSADYGPYQTFFSSPESTGPTTGKITIENFWDVGGAITIELDWTDPGNFKTSIPTQYLYTDSRYGDANISAVGNGTFSSCDKTFTFSYEVTVAAGSFGTFTTTVHL